MIESTWISIWLCVVALGLTIFVIRQRRASLGLPVSYLLGLLLIHLPGAYAYASSGGVVTGVLAGGEYPAVGIQLTAAGSMCFFVGVALALLCTKRYRSSPTHIPTRLNQQFLMFALLGGWLCAFGLTALKALPSIGAAIVFGSNIWILAVMIGIERATARRQVRNTVMWVGATLVYPAIVLLLGGFLSYGSASVIIVASSVIVRIKSVLIVFLATSLLAMAGISIFVNYFASREELRSVLWSNADLESRVNAVGSAFSNFRVFDGNNPAHLNALAARLNQNEFVGLAVERLDKGEIDYLVGRSFWDGVVALVPRAVWPSKPVYGGSPAVVTEVTGLRLNEYTSWGVGNVLEFYINFGMASFIPSFIILGFSLAWLDVHAFYLVSEGNLPAALTYFLPGVALIQPNGSLVELLGGAAAASIAAVGWRHLWRIYLDVTARRHVTAGVPQTQ